MANIVITPASLNADKRTVLAGNSAPHEINNAIAMYNNQVVPGNIIHQVITIVR